MFKLFFLSFFFFPKNKDADISNIAVDKQNGQIYVTEDNILYELDNVVVEQSGVHYTPGPVGMQERGGEKYKKRSYSKA